MAIDAALLSAACNSSSSAQSGPDGSAGDASGAGDGSQSDGTGGDGGAADAGGGGAVYAQTASTLYTLDPTAMALTTVGDFSCTGDAGAVIDVAVDRNGNIYGTTATAFFKVDDPTTAACTIIATLSPDAGFATYPNALSFVPAGTLDPNAEALVGYIDAAYVRIDLTTGAMTTVGSLNPNSLGQSLYSSGDIVSVVDAGTYLTATNRDAGGDFLLAIDPTNGTPTALLGDTTYPKLWGLGYWRGAGYAFSGNGEVLLIDLGDASATPLTVTGRPAGASFYGAGVTTVAPTGP